MKQKSNFNRKARQRSLFKSIDPKQHSTTAFSVFASAKEPKQQKQISPVSTSIYSKVLSIKPFSIHNSAADIESTLDDIVCLHKHARSNITLEQAPEKQKLFLRRRFSQKLQIRCKQIIGSQTATKRTLKRTKKLFKNQLPHLNESDNQIQVANQFISNSNKDRLLVQNILDKFHKFVQQQEAKQKNKAVNDQDERKRAKFIKFVCNLKEQYALNHQQIQRHCIGGRVQTEINLYDLNKDDVYVPAKKNSTKFINLQQLKHQSTFKSQQKHNKYFKNESQKYNSTKFKKVLANSFAKRNLLNTQFDSHL